MNKLLLLPITFMGILTMFAILDNGETYVGSSPDYSDLGNITVNETPSSSISIPGAGSVDLEIVGFVGAIAVIMLAIAIGIVSGIKADTFLGSVALSENAQRLIQNGLIYLGVYACLSVACLQYIAANTILFFGWTGLTVMYCVGFANQMNQTD